MGSNCSTIVCSGVAQPSRKADTVSITPTSGQKSSKRSTNPKARRPSRTEDQSTVIDNSRSPDRHMFLQAKNKAMQGESTSDEAMRGTSFTQATETNVFQYKKGPLIGRGTSGEVYECLRLNTGELLAVKSSKISGDAKQTSSYMETLKREMQMLRSLSHNNIVKYFAVDVTDAPEGSSSIVDIVLEYVSGGSVRLLLDKFNKLEEKVIAKYIRQVLDGMVYLHENGIIHRNIKCSNILIDTTGIIKITDFGRSGRPDRFSEESIPYWSAPEVAMRKAQGKPADVWSVGCVVIEMLTGSPPWADQVKSTSDFTRQIAFGTPPPLPSGISENCRDFLYKTLKFKPEDRPAVSDLLEHPFVKERNQDSSYNEAESIQGEPETRAGQERVLDLLNLEDKMQEKRAVDLKKNNFIKYTTDELSVNGLNLDAFSSFDGEYKAQSTMKSDNYQLSRFVTRDQFDKDPGFISLSKKASSQRLRGEHAGGVPNDYEEEYSEYPEHVVEEMKTGVILKPSPTLPQQTEAERKEAIRRRLEEEMKRDLMMVSGQLSEPTAREEIDAYQTENPLGNDDPRAEDGSSAQSRRRTPPVPKQNSFFTNEDSVKTADTSNNFTKGQGDNATTQFLKYKTGERRQSLKLKGTGGISMNTSDRKEDAKSRLVMEKVDEEADHEEGSPMKASTEEERKAIQEKLRRQFEEQMEQSLARLNSDNVHTINDKEGDQEAEEITSSKLSPYGNRHFEENYSSQIMKISPTKLGSIVGVPGMNNNPIEDDLSENKSINWRRTWGSHPEEHDESPKTVSHMTESDQQSPGDGVNKRKLSGFSKLNIKEVPMDPRKSDSFERIEATNEAEELQYEEIGSGKEVESVTLPDPERKLGVINEAEEVKEDSLYDDEFNARGGSRTKKI